ncbi:hypothetical protein UFOVP838_39 [uncultured Caudovirales phage]|jgi:hypothetical protein|uniref:Uncharacterized protein n=1 Tax=uncultured Caudovirales phage TaxID=2100421 RepID=A0A6J5S2H2_9CAUD|nr:hypothetical protein UFOVP838_39 [uncultured Caudovirales phage]CAB4171773.1 hypothetical protein UFOVP932_28 [uncultured Caudovirales phage]CAB4177599.1 hypothetical protein UFOVP1010_16 [uncultured Caudovirales phage]CAB4201876.1 hypothetical protein UFOVP1359_4 [uncultured Caudovirales phage]
MTNLTVFSAAQLPTASTIQGLRSLQTNSVASGTTILKMDKTGYWVFGADSTDIDPETEWAINPNEFLHGYIAWGEGVVLGEKMVSVSHPLPELDPAPSGARKGWETQLGMSLQALNGEDAGLAVRYTATSVGGRNAIQKIANAIADQLEADPSKPVAVVTLGKETYQHKQYGKIFTPVMTVVRWVGMDGAAEEPEAVAEAAVEEKAPARRRRRD